MNFDFVIIGGGIAGLNAAIRLSKEGRVLVVTKERLMDCNTFLAQGGIAASMGGDDCPKLHFQDTLAAGAGLCDEAAVRVMVEEAPLRIRELIETGMSFDSVNGALALTREGAHCRNRILHAGGDSTGRMIWRALAARATDISGITIWEQTPVRDLLVAEANCLGVSVLEGNCLKNVRARSVLLATGGAGRLYPVTTNPFTATGDGMAMAYRAGAELSDMEFIQFHPTTLAVPEAAGFLISEAVRGEGGIIRNSEGDRFMSQYHPLGELAPRDVVSRAIYREMALAGTGFVYLDVTHFAPGFFAGRFPQIFEQLDKLGINPENAMIPIAPAAHYMMGGVKTGLRGETNISGLYAAGETANTGVHGANRLASNSLLEGLVFSVRAVEEMVSLSGNAGMSPSADKIRSRPVKVYDTTASEMMAQNVGIVRSKEDLLKAAEYFRGFSGEKTGGVMDCQELASCNLGLVAYLSAYSALRREESRGGHFRQDFPEQDPAWVRHLVIKKGEAGEVICQ